MLLQSQPDARDYVVEALVRLGRRDPEHSPTETLEIVTSPPGGCAADLPASGEVKCTGTSPPGGYAADLPASGEVKCTGTSPPGGFAADLPASGR